MAIWIVSYLAVVGWGFAVMFWLSSRMFERCAREAIDGWARGDAEWLKALNDIIAKLLKSSEPR